MALNDLALVTLIQAKAHLRIDVAASLHVDAEYLGMGDSSETHFALEHVTVEGSLRLYVNGVLQIEPTHYSVTELVIVFVTAPTTNYPITVSYNYSAELGMEGEHEINEFLGKGDNSNKEFALDVIPIEGSLNLYVDEDLQVLITDYTIDGLSITFVTAPHNKDIITAIYSHSQASGGNVFESYDDALLENIIEAATKRAEDYTGRAFIQGSITEQYTGDGTKILRLRKWPVGAITSVRRYHYERLESGDGSTVAFTLDNTPITGTVTVYKNGSLQVVSTHYTISGVTITFISAPADGDIITANYKTAVSFTERINIGRLYRESTWVRDYIYEVVYTAGYASTRAATQALIPDAVTAVLLIIANLFENRTDKVDSENISGVGSVSYKLPSEAEKWLMSIKVNVL